jgi:hypothetical protein
MEGRADADGSIGEEQVSQSILTGFEVGKGFR